MEQLLTRLKALADKTRLKIIIILLNYDLCVGALAKHLAISEAAVSQQLQILRKAGLVRGGKRGYWTHYRVEKEIIKQIISDLEELPNRQVNLTFICQRGLAGGKYLSCRKTCFDRIEGPDDANRGDSK
ncbi:MAG: ArsR/SmtB family transcription factor [Dethiobacteria bacterium]|jgi:DNA-binding transcriptional ArsR family regulator|nr:winged helix-turn-helix transcriptional regulator [Bacillota bacterium]